MHPVWRMQLVHGVITMVKCNPISVAGVEVADVEWPLFGHSGQLEAQLKKAAIHKFSDTLSLGAFVASLTSRIERRYPYDKLSLAKSSIVFNA